MYRVATRLLLFLAATFLSTAPSLSKQFQGADEVLRQMEVAQRGIRTRKTPTAPAAVFRREMRDFRERSRDMQPLQAAKEWLRFVERFAAESQVPAANVRSIEFAEVISVIPPPSTWSALAQEISSRRVSSKNAILQNALSLLSHTLLADPIGQTQDMARMENKLTGPGWQRGAIAGQLIELSEQLAEQSGDPQRIAKSVELKLSMARNSEQGNTVDIPDLVQLLGPDMAERILRKALLIPSVRFDTSAGEATKAMARRLALAMIDKLPVPRWDLAQSMDAASLYEALDRKFEHTKADARLSPAARAAMEVSSNRDPGERDAAQAYYLMALIVGGRNDDALRLAGTFNNENASYTITQAVDALERSGRSRLLYDFLHGALSRNPKLKLWEAFLSAAASTGHSMEMVALVRSCAERTDLPASMHSELKSHLYRALLAADKLDDAVAVLRSLMKDSPASVNGRFTVSGGSHAVELAQLGLLLHRKDWTEEGIHAAMAEIERGQMESAAHPPSGLIDVLLETGRGPDAERLLVGELTGAQAAAAFSAARFGRSGGSSALSGFVNLYSRAGRYQDVIALFERAAGWGAKDLAGSGLYATAVEDSERREMPLGYFAAKALAEVGRKTQAINILEALLYARGGFDPAYSLLIELRGIEALPYLDHLFKLNRFEERPLIWKASLLLKEGRLEEAEKAARDAISIDPSDGEEGPGDRMRVYTVLADIRDARGDKKEATLYRGAVQAIRHAEAADKFWQAGLLTRAIAMYEESLTHFADAYCIQSRLAVQLAAQGRYQEAEEHYRKAYELMPDSFGRMESHCFGCEGVFRGKRAASIAEKVFTEFAVRFPRKPQIHYLLGYLRNSQGRPEQALPHFRTAVALDPDYVNAWREIRTIGAQVRLPRKEMDAAAFRLTRLGQLGEGDLGDVADFKELWQAVEDAREHLLPEPPASLFPLPASAAALLKDSPFTPQILEEDDSLLTQRQIRNYDFRVSLRNRLSSPGEVISEHRTIAAISQLVGYAVSSQE